MTRFEFKAEQAAGATVAQRGGGLESSILRNAKFIHKTFL